MTNIIREQQQKNQELLNEIELLKKQLAENEQENEQLKASLQFKQLNNDEIREWVISILRSDYSPSDMDAEAIDIVMKIYIGQEKEDWSLFCKNYPTEPVRKNYILTAYKFNHYYITRKLYWTRDGARKKIFINLIKLNSEESKELFRKWLSEGKVEESDKLTAERIIEKGYEEDRISQIRYDYFNIEHFSLDELISSWNELTVSANKKVAKVNELERAVEELKAELEEQDNKIEELEERVDIEVEMNLKALDKAEEWHDRKIFEVAKRKDIKLIELRVENQELRKSLEKERKTNKLQQLKKLVKKAKEKVQEKFNTYILQKDK
jgi:hypothetical protein